MAEFSVNPARFDPRELRLGAPTEVDARTEPTARRQWIFAELVDEISGTGEIFPECVCDNPRAG